MTKRAAVQATARVLGIDSSPFDRIFELTETNKSRLTRSEAENLFGNYIAEIQKVIDAVDQVERNQ